MGNLYYLLSKPQTDLKIKKYFLKTITKPLTNHSLIQHFAIQHDSYKIK